MVNMTKCPSDSGQRLARHLRPSFAEKVTAKAQIIGKCDGSVGPARCHLPSSAASAWCGQFLQASHVRISEPSFPHVGHEGKQTASSSFVSPCLNRMKLRLKVKKQHTLFRYEVCPSADKAHLPLHIKAPLALDFGRRAFHFRIWRDASACCPSAAHASSDARNSFGLTFPR